MTIGSYPEKINSPLSEKPRISLRLAFLKEDGQLREPAKPGPGLLSPVEKIEHLLLHFGSHLGEADIVPIAVGYGHRRLIRTDAEFRVIEVGHRFPVAGPQGVPVVREDAVRPGLGVAVGVLVGPIRDQGIRRLVDPFVDADAIGRQEGEAAAGLPVEGMDLRGEILNCLLYTSDAADE